MQNLREPGTYPIQTHNVIVAFTSVELNGKSSGVTAKVWKLASESDGGKAHEDRSLDAFAREKVGLVIS